MFPCVIDINEWHRINSEPFISKTSDTLQFIANSSTTAKLAWIGSTILSDTNN